MAKAMTELHLSDAVLKRRVFKEHVNKHLRETTILRVLAPYVDKTKVAIDVGAATGHITCWLAEHARSVDAYEAVPPVHEQLKKWSDRRNNVNTVCMAVTDWVGASDFYVDDKRLSNSGFQDLVGGPCITVPTTTLDTVYGDSPAEVGFIKIDVEGSEYDVLKGAKWLLARDEPNLMIEIYQPFSKYPLDWIFHFLMDQRGYACAYYDHPNLVQVPDVAAGVKAVETKHKAHDGDFLFYRKERGQ